MVDERACSLSDLEDRDSWLNLDGQGQDRDYKTGGSVSEVPRRRPNQYKLALLEGMTRAIGER